MLMLRKPGLVTIVTAAAVAGLVFAAGPTRSQQAQYSYPPLSLSRAQYYQQNPAAFQALLERLPKPTIQAPPANTLAPGQPPVAGAWTTLTNLPGVNLSNPILMTDGTVIAHVSCNAAWWKLTPDSTGSYINGSWTQIASLPSGYTPRFFGSSVLPDGRVIIEGGEYNTGCAADWTKLGAIYNPVTNTWASVTPPSGWAQIGDAAGIVLPNGTYMQTDCCDSPPKAALLNPSTLAWTATGTGKFDVYDEEAMALQQDGTVLTVDAYVFAGCGTGTEDYSPATGKWTSAGNVPNQQSDCNSSFPSDEVGPLVTRPNGSAVSFSGLTTGTAGTAIYGGGSFWYAGANIPYRLHAGGRSGRGAAERQYPVCCQPWKLDRIGAVSNSDPLLRDGSEHQPDHASPRHVMGVEHELLSVQFRGAANRSDSGDRHRRHQRHPDLHARRQLQVELATGHHLGALMPRRQRDLYVERHAIERPDRRFVLRRRQQFFGRFPDRADGQ